MREPPKIENFDADAATALTQFLQYIADTLDSGLLIDQNLNTKILDVTFENPAQEVAVDHGLGREAKGFFVVDKPVATDVSKTDRQGDANRIYLESTVATTVKILFF